MSHRLLCVCATFFASLGVAASAHSAPRADREQVPAGRAKALLVQSAAGELKIRAKRGDAFVLTQNKTLGADSCKARLQVQNAQASLTIGDPSGRPCAIDVELWVPPALDVHVEQQDGHLMISGTRGALRVHVGKGNAVVGGTFSRLSATMDAGSISVQGLNGDGELQVASGNAQVFFAPHAQGTLKLDVAQGNATVYADRPVAVRAQLSAPELLSNALAPEGTEAALSVVGQLGHGRLAIKASR